MTSGFVPRTVVDTNILVSGFFIPRGWPCLLIEAWRARRFLLMLSDDLRAEYERVLSRPKFTQLYGVSEREVADFLSLIRVHSHHVEPSPVAVDVRDQRDIHVLAAALGARADYLVTGDNDLLVLAGRPELGSLLIVTVKEFLTILESLGCTEES